MARTLIVGDIHGCFDELQALLRMAALGAHDTVIATGDIVDRGPKPWETVAFFLEDPVHRKCVLGNHEEKHLTVNEKKDDGAALHSEEGAWRYTRRMVTPDQYSRMLEYFRTFPRYLNLPEALIVHAGVAAGVPLEAQEERVLSGRGSQGRPGWDGTTTWWFDEPSFTWEKPVVFGHSVFPHVRRGAQGTTWGLDTGVAVGGSLSGLLLPEWRVLSVPAQCNHYQKLLDVWYPRLLVEHLPELPWKQVLELNAEKFPAELRKPVENALAVWCQLKSRLVMESSEVTQKTGWATIPAERKAGVMQQLRTEARFQTTWGRLVLASLSGVREEVIMKSYPTPGSYHAG